ncbi:MAG: hypothetical protein U1U88_002246 [Lawsonella clevelandensis]
MTEAAYPVDVSVDLQTPSWSLPTSITTIPVAPSSLTSISRFPQETYWD